MKKCIPSLILLVSFISFLPVCQAREPSDFTDAFFKKVQAGEISQAYDQLFVGSPITTQKPQAVNILKRQTSTVLPLYGRILGFEKIKEEEIGKSIMRLVYILKLEMMPTAWEFYFYKPAGSWYLVNVKFNDELQFK